MFKTPLRRGRRNAPRKSSPKLRRLPLLVEQLEDRRLLSYTFEPIARVGDPAPGPESGTFTYLEFEALNSAGQASFGGGVPEGEGLFLHGQAGNTQVVRSGEAAPGGGTFGPVGLFGPTTLNDAGDAGIVFLLKNRDPNDPDHQESPNGINAGVYRYNRNTQSLSAIEVPDVTPVPGGAAGETFKGATQGVHLNNAGALVFPGIVPATVGPGVDGSHQLGIGIFEASTSGQIIKIVRPGDPAPDGQTFDYSANPTINNQGDVAFGAHVSADPFIPLGQTLPNAIFTAESVYLKHADTGVIESIAHQGAAIPASAGGGTFDYAFGPVVNDRDQVVFIGAIQTSPGHPENATTGVFLSSNGGLIAVARPGDAMPGGGRLANVSFSTGAYDLNDNGDVMFTAVLDTGDEGLYLWSNGTLSVVARTGTVLSGGGTIDSFDSRSAGDLALGAALNERGQVLFGATLAGGSQELLVATPSLQLTENQAFTGEVARFTDPNSNRPAGDFTATIDWDDGHFTAGTVTALGQGQFSVRGTNTYAEEGSYVIHVQVTDTVAGTTTALTTSATVADAALAALGTQVSVSAETTVNGVVATFTDAGGPEVSGHYTATINWGDGTAPALGTISQSGTTLTVSASHTYASHGRFPVLVTLHDDGGSSAIAHSLAIVLTPNQRFVAQAFRNLLGREADHDGLTFFSGQLDAGASRDQVIAGIQGSPEYRSHLVDSVYLTFLGRRADASGLENGLDILANGGTVEDLEAFVAGSPEYLHNRGSDTADGFLAALYYDVFGRGVDDGAQQTFTPAVAAGERMAVASAVLNSLEGRQDRAQDLFHQFLLRDAESQGQDFFTQAFQGGLRDEQAMALVAGTDEYFSLAASNPNPGIVPVGAPYFGKTYGEWAASWWQYVYSLPSDQGPFFDETGANLGNGQSGPVFFLSGVVNDSGTATRTGTVPAGKALFFPILNFESDLFAPPLNPPPSVEGLRAQAKGNIDGAAGLTADIDGVPVLTNGREQSPVFSVDFPDNNVFQHFGFNVPKGHYTPFVDDGYYAMLAPLPVGPHTIHFHGGIPAANFTLDITYHVMVLPPKF